MNPTNPNEFFSAMAMEGAIPASIALRADRLLSQTAPAMPVVKTYTPPIAKQVIFNPPATIVYWDDDTKTVVKCDNDEFSEEFGFAMACVRKIYGTRNSFKAQFKDAFRPYLKQEKEKVVEAHAPQPEPEKKAPTKKKVKPSVRIINAGDIDSLGLDQLLRSLACGDSIAAKPCDCKGVFTVHL